MTKPKSVKSDQPSRPDKRPGTMLAADMLEDGFNPYGSGPVPIRLRESGDDER